MFTLRPTIIPSGSLTLSGLVYEPQQSRSDVSLVLAHGFTACKAGLDGLASYMASRGYRCLTFDFRGHKLGCSGGDLNDAAETLDDMRAAIAATDSRQVVLIGHSMGALVSLLVGAVEESVAGVVAIATGAEPSAGFRQPLGIAMLSQRADYVSGRPAIEILQQFDGLAQSLIWPDNKPSLFVAAGGDVIVKPQRVRDLATRCSGEYAEVEGSHLDAADRARGVIANWLESQFPPA